MRLGVGILALSMLLAADLSEAQTCFYCAVNQGCYPTGTGWYPCWRDSSGRCQLGTSCALAGGGRCEDPECLPRPVPLSVAKTGVGLVGKAKVPTTPEIHARKKTRVYVSR